MLGDIDKTVDFGPNYDGSEKAAGPAQQVAQFAGQRLGRYRGGHGRNIPPHNLNEVVDACLHLLRNPESTIDELMEIIRRRIFPPQASSTASTA